jgi:hypothetical protein
VNRTFLAIHDIAAPSEPDVRRALERVTEEAHHRGLRPVETFYSLDRRRAYTYVVGDTPERVREAFAAAGVPGVDVVPGRRLYTELLDEPRRSR